MKILLVDHNYPKDTPFLLNKYRELSRNNDIMLVHWGKAVSGGVIRNRSNGTNKIQLIRGFIFLLLLRPFNTLNLLSKGYRLLGLNIVKLMMRDNAFFREPADLIHFEFGTLAVDRMYLKQLLGCKIVVSFRGYDLNYYRLNNSDVYDDVWKASDGFHFLGNDLLQRAIRRGYPNNKPNFLITPAIDTTLFDTKNKVYYSGGTFQVISVGRLVWKKGFEYALLAIKQLVASGNDIHYTIVGDGPLRTALAFAIHQLGITNNVTLAGKCTQQALRKKLEQSHLFLHPAVSEGFCNAVIEAQAMLLPVVCTNADGLAENIQDGVTGHIVPVYDAAALASHTAKLISQHDLLREMGKNGRARVLTHFELGEQIARFTQMYASFNKPNSSTDHQV